ncbi:hypothetical protein CON72_23485 [Bacillus wiedmannii]|nr:hypothetical protein CON72_23485 [Bacillus wiedmannii]
MLLTLFCKNLTYFQKLRNRTKVIINKMPMVCKINALNKYTMPIRNTQNQTDFKNPSLFF